MTLSRVFSGGEPKIGEDRIGGGPLSLTPDPILYARQARGGLMDVIAVGDIDKGFKELLETFVVGQDRRGCRIAVAGRASRRAHRRQQFFDRLHPRAFPRGIPALAQSLPAAG